MKNNYGNFNFYILYKPNLGTFFWMVAFIMDNKVKFSDRCLCKSYLKPNTAMKLKWKKKNQY